MKKVAVLLLAAGLVFGAAHKGAQAADIKVSGEWDFNTEWNNIGFAKEKADDLFHARQRLRTQVDIIASESLKAVQPAELRSWRSHHGERRLGRRGHHPVLSVQ